MLLVDNCSSHAVKRDLALSNVKVEFFPANTTSVSQPMDMGIIRSIKAAYRKRLLEKIVRSLTNTGEMPKIGIDTAIYLLAAAWDSVSRSTIENCWRKAGFRCTEAVEMEIDFDAFDEGEPAEFDRLMVEALGMMNIRGEELVISSDDFITADDQLVTQAPSDMSAVCEGLQAVEEEASSDEDMEIDSEGPPLITSAVAIQYAQQLKRFLQTVPDVPLEIQLSLHKMESLLEQHRFKALKQRSIEDFFV